MIVGLAPAAHGANRTGRMFTGDGTGGSSDFLMTALHANGLANQPTSQRADDGLVLTDTWMLAAARCAPPDNKPTPEELANCHEHFRAELDTLPQRARACRARQDRVRRVPASLRRAWSDRQAAPGVHPRRRLSPRPATTSSRPITRAGRTRKRGNSRPRCSPRVFATARTRARNLGNNTGHTEKARRHGIRVNPFTP